MGTKTWTNASQQEQDASYAARTKNVAVGSRVKIGEYAIREDASPRLDDMEWTVYRVASREERTPSTFHLINETGEKTCAYSVAPINGDPVSRYTDVVDRLNGTMQELAREQQHHEAFKCDVVRVASEYADTHGWCDEIDEALDDLGLKRDPQTATFTFTVTVQARDFSTDMARALRLYEETGEYDEAWMSDTFRFAVHPDGDCGSAETDTVTVTDIEVDLT